MSKWDELSLPEKAEMIGVAVKRGYTNLSDIRDKYNEFAEGGSTDDDLVDWIIREEGFIGSPQDIGDGKMTIGSGLTAKKWHDQYKRNGNRWTIDDNRRAVKEEVANRRKWAEKNIPNWDSLPSSSQKALLSYKYNYDFNRANSPKLFKALADSNLQEAARQMDATSSNPMFKKGLQDRRQREQEWFLQDVASSQSSDITYQPAVSTQIYNPYIQQVEATRMLPISEPDPNSYIRTREVSPQEQRRRKFQENVEAYQRFNALMNLIDLRNNPAPSYNPIYSLFGDNTEGFAKGGKIHIKPENRGKFTALKKRTGHSATWFKEHGTPAQKKMATFALNSRHWKHGLGGNLFDGTTEDSQQMQIGLKATNGWKPYTLDDILANAARIEQQKQAMEDRLNNVFTLSNDATSVANGRPQNRHLERRAVEGAKAHRAWEEEHPIAAAWGNVLGAVPLAVASYPFVTGAVVPGVTALGDAAAATTAGKALTSALSPIMTAATTSWYGTPAWEWANTGLNAIFSAHGLNTAMEEKGVSPTTALELAPMLTLGKPIKTAADNIERRGIEVAMRSGAGADGLQNSIDGFNTLRKTAEGRERLKRIGNYILTGDRKGIDGTYNSLSVMKDSNTPGAVRVYRGSEVGDTYDASKKDLIDAFLYGETIDPSFGLTKIAQGENFGVHAPYIAENYASKASKIPVYEVNTPLAVPESEVVPSGNWVGRDAGTFTSKEGSATNVAGHLKQTGMTAEGREVEQGQDIWKFLGKDYWKKWLAGQKRGLLEKAILKAGLHEVNRLGTPVITRTKWAPDYQTYEGWNKSSIFSDAARDMTFGSLLKPDEMEGLFKVVGKKSFALDDYKLPDISIDFTDMDYFTK